MTKRKEVFREVRIDKYQSLEDLINELSKFKDKKDVGFEITTEYNYGDEEGVLNVGYRELETEEEAEKREKDEKRWKKMDQDRNRIKYEELKKMFEG